MEKARNIAADAAPKLSNQETQSRLTLSSEFSTPKLPNQSHSIDLPQSPNMSTEETISKSPLDKPLYQLTEDDISQLTREDCRRYLKDKGMRRPSWNKSQAIQQVISLKTLLETTSDADAGACKRLYIPRTENPHRVPRGTSADTEISVSAEESVPCQQKDPDKPDLSGDLSPRLITLENDSVPIRTTGVKNGPVGQMTIFYSGKVNVYDDVPPDKAQAIMQLAASPFHLPQEGSYDAVRTLPLHLQATSVKLGPDSSVMLLPTLQTVKMTDNCRLHREESNTFIEDNPAEGPPSRKASVQRYLEKKKDRYKSRRNVGAPSCASLDIFLKHQIGSQIPNEHSSRSGGRSPPPIKPPNTPNRCSSVENNILKNNNLSSGLNDKDLQD